MKRITANLRNICCYGVTYFEETGLHRAGANFIYTDIKDFRKSVEGIVFATGGRVYNQLRRDMGKEGQ